VCELHEGKAREIAEAMGFELTTTEITVDLHRDEEAS
jgi:hypothetical protein